MCASTRSRAIDVLTAALITGLALVLSAACTVADASASEGAGAVGLERAHAHNDYEHDRPLFDALSRGFKSVEADVWLVDGELLVAHDREDVQSGRTLESLYLAPLRELVRRNGGSVYPGDPDYFTLLIDIKSDAVPTYRALHRELRRHQQMLTRFGPSGVDDGAVTAIVSGNRPRELMQQQRIRYAAYDGRLADLGVATDPAFVPLISDNWTRHFVWDGNGPMPETEREKLRSIVETAHANGQRVRFWATPEQSPQREAVWQELLAAQVDYINTDHLQALQDFLLRNDPQPSEPYVDWSASGESVRAARGG
jgi:glycerophosphoryl diester phosphodiesterase